MAGFFLCLVHFLCWRMLLVNGQCTLTGSESDEDIRRSLEEHEIKLNSLAEQLLSIFGNLETNVKKTIARGLEGHDENLREALQNFTSGFVNGLQKIEKHAQNTNDIYQDTSIKPEKFDERIQNNECLKVEEKKQFLMDLILNWSSKVEKIDESIKALNETLERKLEEPNPIMISLYQNLSARLDSFYAKYDVVQTGISEKEGENVKKLELMDQDLSSKFKSTDESLLRVLENDENIQQMYEQLSSRLQAMNESMVRSFIDNELKLQTIHENFTTTVGKFYEKLNDVLDLVNQSIQHAEKVQCNCSENSPDLGISDCSTIRLEGNTTSGVHRVFVDYRQKRYYANASCDMTTTSGNWTVFQRRKDGSVDFERGWNDYASGFGHPSGEFWIGNEFLHLLTSKRQYRLRIDLEDFSGNKRFAEYSIFSIGSSNDSYRLTVGNYSGDAGDSLSYHSCNQFSTIDQDNGKNKRNCSYTERGAWWYDHCHQSNLNGFYYHGGNYALRGRFVNGNGIVWKNWLSYSYSLKTTEMKISPY